MRRGKSIADKSQPKNQKHLLLDRFNSYGSSRTELEAKPAGEMKGILKSVEVSGSNILITIESGEFLEMKVRYERSVAYALILNIISL